LSPRRRWQPRFSQEGELSERQRTHETEQCSTTEIEPKQNSRRQNQKPAAGKNNYATTGESHTWRANGRTEKSSPAVGAPGTRRNRSGRKREILRGKHGPGDQLAKTDERTNPRPDGCFKHRAEEKAGPGARNESERRKSTRKKNQ
jgi:hypothetical protein